MKGPSNFIACLFMTMVVIVGVALLPRIDVGVNPPPRQGKSLMVDLRWRGVTAKVMENSVTSIVEGAMSSVRGVENVSSESFAGRGRVKILLKEGIDVSSVRFEMSSLLRQIYSRLPRGVEYPVLTGGEVVNDDGGERKLLLTYNVNADLAEDKIGEYLNHGFLDRVRQIDGVKNVTLSGGEDYYIELKYNPLVLRNYGLTSADIANAVRNFTGRKNVVGEVATDDATGKAHRRTLCLAAGAMPIAEIPVTCQDGEVIYLNHIVEQTLKRRHPEKYYRINGLNTVNVNVEVDGDANAIILSSSIRKAVGCLAESLPEGMYLTLAYDAAAEERTEMADLVGRSLLSLVFLLLFVWIANRSWKYLAVVSLSLALNLLLAVVVYWLLHLRLHVYSMAGMAVSLSLIIDATIVMADHYGYYRNRKAFLAILAAMLTTIGSLVSVVFLPEEWQDDLYDFVRIICINLSVSLLVALWFVPVLVEVFHYSSRQGRTMKALRRILMWNRVYENYIQLVRRWRWIVAIVVVALFGYTLKGFIDHLDDVAERGHDEPLSLHIVGEVPQGGTAFELNAKVVQVENTLKRYPEIKRFVTSINGRRARIDVDFQDSVQFTVVPFRIEQEVTSQLIGIGGADWAVYGVSPMGFSNSLNLQHRSSRLWITGYNYDYVARYADDLCRMLSQNNRVRDLQVKSPDRDLEENELYMDYDRERMSVYGVGPNEVHSDLANLLQPTEVGTYDDGHGLKDVVLYPVQVDKFDNWYIGHSYVSGKDHEFKTSSLMSVRQRAAQNYIQKKNQEYVLSVEFNVLGSYQYTANYLEEVTDRFSKTLPMGYRCGNPVYSSKNDKEAPYWIVGVVVVVIFFICSILFESLRMPFVIISVIPFSFIGIFLTFRYAGLEFGSGGLASMVMLAGIVVNSAIYVLNEYRFLCRCKHGNRQTELSLYVKAYNHKIIPVLLTVLSTVFGLVPFFFDGEKAEPFWLSFAAGVVGGLLFSVFVIVFILPLALNVKRRR